MSVDLQLVDIFKRNGKKIKVDKMRALLDNELLKNSSLATWYKQNKQEAETIRNKICHHNGDFYYSRQ